MRYAQLGNLRQAISGNRGVSKSRDSCVGRATRPTSFPAHVGPISVHGRGHEGEWPHEDCANSGCLDPRLPYRGWSPLCGDRAPATTCGRCRTVGTSRHHRDAAPLHSNQTRNAASLKPSQTRYPAAQQFAPADLSCNRSQARPDRISPYCLGLARAGLLMLPNMTTRYRAHRQVLPSQPMSGASPIDGPIPLTFVHCPEAASAPATFFPIRKGTDQCSRQRTLRRLGRMPPDAHHESVSKAN
jgi:hypothetical protein